MAMTGLCDLRGFRMRDGGSQTQFIRSLNLIQIRFSDKPANGFLLNNLTGLRTNRLVFFVKHITN